jgi:hypothetical protein
MVKTPPGIRDTPQGKGKELSESFGFASLTEGQPGKLNFGLPFAAPFFAMGRGNKSGAQAQNQGRTTKRVFEGCEQSHRGFPEGRWSTEYRSLALDKAASPRLVSL